VEKIQKRKFFQKKIDRFLSTKYSTLHKIKKKVVLRIGSTSFYDLKEDIFSTPEDNQIIEKTEEENIINDAEQTLEGDQEKDQKIVFYNI